jgi:2-haloacid dehalogenase
MTPHPQLGEQDREGTTIPNETGVPRVMVFDVNETLSDMSAMAQRFIDVSAPGHLAATWFASLLRDGFALTATGANPSFAELGAEALRVSLTGRVSDIPSAVDHIMSGFTSLQVHPDVAEGIQNLHRLGISLVTLSNGSSSVAQGLLDRSGLTQYFDRLLSVEEAPLWKPAAAAYSFALKACGCDASEAMLVAVHPWDVHGAEQAGLATAWLNRTGARYPSYFSAPGIEAVSLVDLAAQLGGVAG